MCLICLFVFFTEKSESARHGGCFEENSIVYDRVFGPKWIKHVQLGDQLLSVAPDGTLQYSEVLMFLDRDPDVRRLYYRFQTESGRTITVTPAHLLYVTDDGNTTTERITSDQTEFAKNVQVGQYLFVNENGQYGVGQRTSLDRILSVRAYIGHGVYAPLTGTGTLVVNNVTASCYAVVNSQTLAHWTFMPVRLMHAFIEFGDHLTGRLQSLVLPSANHSRSVSSRTNTASAFADKRTLMPSNGVHWYARLLYKMFGYFIPKSILFD